MALFDIPARLWTLARKVEDLFSLQVGMRESLEMIDLRLRSLEERMIRLESEQIRLAESAKAAAGVAAAAVASAVISDLVTRVTKVEMQQSLIQARLPSN